MSKQGSEGLPAAEGGRRPTGVAGNPSRPDRGRWSSRRKAEVVLRVLRGESLDALSRELGVTASRLARWRDEFLAGGQAALRSRDGQVQDEEVQRLRSKVGEITMDNELLYEKIHRLEANLPPELRRPKR